MKVIIEFDDADLENDTKYRKLIGLIGEKQTNGEITKGIEETLKRTEDKSFLPKKLRKKNKEPDENDEETEEDTSLD